MAVGTSSTWAKLRRMLARPEMFTYLDRLHKQVEALPGDAAVKHAIVRAEVLRRQPEQTEVAGMSAAAARAGQAHPAKRR